MCRLIMVTLLAELGNVVRSELTLSVYNNSAMYGEAAETKTIPGLELTLPRTTAYSAEVTGTLTYDHTTFYAFSCSITNAEVAMVWIGDHLICNSNPPFGATSGSTDGTRMYPLMGQKGQLVPVVIHVYNSGSGASLGMSVQWARLQQAVPHDAPVNFEDVPGSALKPKLPPLELQRRALQQKSKEGLEHLVIQHAWCGETSRVCGHHYCSV